MTPRPTPQFNLSLQDAIVVLEEQAKKNEGQTQRGEQTRQLQGMSLDQAYDVGYSTMLYDLKSLTGPDPFEVHAVVVDLDGEFTDLSKPTWDADAPRFNKEKN